MISIILSSSPKDLDSLIPVASSLVSYNLPNDDDYLRQLLELSERSFQGRVRDVSRARYLFVAEQRGTRQLIGCSMIIAQHGRPGWPHIALDQRVRFARSRSLRRVVAQPYLQLVTDERGPTEVAGLVVRRQFRRSQAGYGTQLSWVRFAYLAAHRSHFRRNVLVECAGWHPPHGNPLWAALGGPATGMSYQEADRLSVTNKEFILSLFPRTPLYLSHLPKDAREAIGRAGGGGGVHALHMLRRLGFTPNGQVGPFDGGPHYTVPLSRISLVQRTRRATVRMGPVQGRSHAIILVERNDQTRAAVLRCSCRDNWVRVDETGCRALGLEVGERVWVTPWPASRR